MNERFELQQTLFHVLDFEQIFRLEQSELKAALVEELKASGYRPQNKKGFLYAPGEVPVMLVAHMDTVHRQLVNRICYSTDGMVMMSPEGIGSDDRAGIYMILRVIQQAKCHVLFCEDEETGGQGARKFTQRNICPDINYIIEMDRRGSNDAVFYGCCNREFTDYICSFGFEEAMGSFSDISVIAPHLEVAAVNISAGYYQEHRLNEYVRLDQMERNAERILEIVRTDTERFDYVGRSSSYNRYFGMEEMTLWNMGRDDRGAWKELMRLPETACLSIGSHVLSHQNGYYIDKNSYAYQHLPELDVVVALDGTAACTETGDPIPFDRRKATRLRVMDLEQALDLLRAG